MMCAVCPKAIEVLGPQELLHGCDGAKTSLLATEVGDGRRSIRRGSSFLLAIWERSAFGSSLDQGMGFRWEVGTAMETQLLALRIGDRLAKFSTPRAGIT